MGEPLSDSDWMDVSLSFIMVGTVIIENSAIAMLKDQENDENEDNEAYFWVEESNNCKVELSQDFCNL